MLVVCCLRLSTTSFRLVSIQQPGCTAAKPTWFQAEMKFCYLPLQRKWSHHTSWVQWVLQTKKITPFPWEVKRLFSVRCEVWGQHKFNGWNSCMITRHQRTAIAPSSSLTSYLRSVKSLWKNLHDKLSLHFPSRFWIQRQSSRIQVEFTTRHWKLALLLNSCMLDGTFVLSTIQKGTLIKKFLSESWLTAKCQVRK